MKKLILLLLITFSTSIYAQDVLRFEINKNSEFRINGNIVNNQTTFAKVVELLGQPELIKESKSGVKSYAYVKYGIVFKVNHDKLTMIGFNYNWDGDKNFPNTSFTGVLAVGNVQLDANTNKDFMKKNEFITFESLYLGLYAAKLKDTMIMVGFKDEKITQIGFEFKSE